MAEPSHEENIAAAVNLLTTAVDTFRAIARIDDSNAALDQIELVADTVDAVCDIVEHQKLVEEAINSMLISAFLEMLESPCEEVVKLALSGLDRLVSIFELAVHAAQLGAFQTLADMFIATPMTQEYQKTKVSDILAFLIAPFENLRIKKLALDHQIYTEHIEMLSNKDENYVERALQFMWCLTESFPAAARKVAQTASVIEKILETISNSDAGRNGIRVISNIARDPSLRELLPTKDVVELLSGLISIPEGHIQPKDRVLSAIVIANLLKPTDIVSEPVLKLLKSTLTEIITTGNIGRISQMHGVLAGLLNICVNEDNKDELGIIRIFGTLFDVLSMETSKALPELDESKLYAAQILWQLSFIEENRTAIEKLGLIEDLNLLKNSVKDLELRKAIDGVLWNFGTASDIPESMFPVRAEAATHPKFIVILQTSDDKVASKIALGLEQKGYSVLYKFDFLGHEIDSIKKAGTIVGIIDQKFNNSPEGRAMLAVVNASKNEFVPVILDKGIAYNTWLTRGLKIWEKLDFAEHPDEKLIPKLTGIISEFVTAGDPIDKVHEDLIPPRNLERSDSELLTTSRNLERSDSELLTPRNLLERSDSELITPRNLERDDSGVEGLVTPRQLDNEDPAAHHQDGDQAQQQEAETPRAVEHQVQSEAHSAPTSEPVEWSAVHPSQLQEAPHREESIHGANSATEHNPAHVEQDHEKSVPHDHPVPDQNVAEAHTGELHPERERGEAPSHNQHAVVAEAPKHLEEHHEEPHKQHQDASLEAETLQKRSEEHPHETDGTRASHIEIGAQREHSVDEDDSPVSEARAPHGGVRSTSEYVSLQALEARQQHFLNNIQEDGYLKPIDHPRAHADARPVSAWSSKDVGAWLSSINLNACVRHFEDQRVTGVALTEIIARMNDTQFLAFLQQNLKFDTFGDYLTFLGHARKLAH